MWYIIIGWLVVGGIVAKVMDSCFDIGGPVDPGASGSRLFPRWAVLAAIVLLWPFAPLVALFAFISWIASGSH